MVFKRSGNTFALPLPPPPPTPRPPRLSQVSPMLPLKQIRSWPSWQCPCVVLSREVVDHCPLISLCSPGDRWRCNVIGFVPAGSVSSSSTFQIFRNASHLWWLLCPPVYARCHFIWCLGGCRTLTYASLGFPFHFSLFVAGSLNLSEWWHNYVVWLSPLETTQRRACVTECEET